MYKKVLLPVSGKHAGERAKKALQHAAHVADGEIVLLHIYEPLSQLVGGKAHEKLAEEAKDKGMHLLGPVIAEVEKRGIPYSVKMAEGSRATTIVKIAHEKNCDLIAMFTDGPDHFTDILLGSVTERVLRYTDIPLLVIRK